MAWDGILGRGPEGSTLGIMFFTNDDDLDTYVDESKQNWDVLNVGLGMTVLHAEWSSTSRACACAADGTADRIAPD